MDTNIDILPSYEMTIDENVINKIPIEKKLKSLKIIFKILVFLYICLLITVILFTNFRDMSFLKIILILLSFNHILGLFWVYFVLIKYIKNENKLDYDISAGYIAFTLTLLAFLLTSFLVFRLPLIFNWDLIFWLISGLFVVVLSITSLICLLLYEIIKWFIIF